MTDALAGLSEALAERYRILREVGAGGMATVYLAEDLRHDRRVAVKVLRPELAAVIGAERFLTEIRTTAALQHPHILPLFDSGQVESRGGRDAEGDDLSTRSTSSRSTFLYYVMPYVEGESLRDRLQREKQLPIGTAVRLATEVASALDYAHRHGVIHRDIKPENVLLHDGQALVADFGIALAASKAGGSRMTETGMSLGTPHYMSPEQAMGERDISPAADVYALGVMTYEMLTGEPPFTGPTAQSIVAKVVTERPAPIRPRRETVPPEVEDAVLTALAKLPADRFATAAEFAQALAGGASTPRRRTAATTPTAAGSAARRLLTYGPFALVAIIAAWGWARRTPGPPREIVRFTLEPGTGSELAFPVSGVVTYVALSPDGRKAVYAASRGGRRWTLDLRDLDRLNARTLPGTEGASHPEFSPSGRWIAFGAADGSLRKVSVEGTGLSTIAPLDPGGISGLSWLNDEELVFTRTNLRFRGLWRVSAAGGRPARMSQFDSASGERLQLAPRAVDGGRLVFYSSTQASNLDLKLGVVTVVDGRAKVFPDISIGRVLGLVDGMLIYVGVAGELLAAPFDSRRLEVGPPRQVLDSIGARAWWTPAALSRSGSLLYQRGGLTQVVRVDLGGNERVLLDSARAYLHPRLSPNGQRLALEVTGAAGNEIWVADLTQGTFERLTRDGFSDRPEWSPDGTRVMYSSSRTTANSLWWQAADGSGPPELVYQASDAIREGVFTPDGRSIVLRQDTPDSNRDIYRLPLDGDRTPVAILTNGDDDKHPRVSPDGSLLAYVSNESGREEVYIRPLQGRAARLRVSTSGGGEPLWDPGEGRKLFYRAGTALMAATITTLPSLAVVSRDTVLDGPYPTDPWHPNYDVAPDGRSFILLRPVEEQRKLVMVVNWIEELRAASSSLEEQARQE